MVITGMKLTVAAAAVAATMCFNVPASRASGDAPWCAVINLGDGDVHWDCQYRTVEECVPNVLAGNRGTCNQNPYWRGPSVPQTVGHHVHHKRHHRHANEESKP